WRIVSLSASASASARSGSRADGPPGRDSMPRECSASKRGARSVTVRSRGFASIHGLRARLVILASFVFLVAGASLQEPHRHGRVGPLQITAGRAECAAEPGDAQSTAVRPIDALAQSLPIGRRSWLGRSPLARRREYPRQLLIEQAEPAPERA